MNDTKLIDVSDIVFRRVGRNLKEDLVKEVYAGYEGDKIRLTFILGNHLDTNTLASIGARYNHAFADVHDKYLIKMLDQPNHFTADNDTYIIWTYSAGFIIPD